MVMFVKEPMVVFEKVMLEVVFEGDGIEKELMGVMVFEKGGSDGDDGVWCWYQAISDNCHSTHWLAAAGVFVHSDSLFPL